jgi:prepilin-type N-terminal cleavage/methylation domain-containing protein
VTPSHARAGLTLIELIVALTITALVLLGARVMMEGVADAAARVAAGARRGDEEANAERLLRSVVGRLEAGTDKPFTGDIRKARFSSWCDVPGGWQDPCEVAVVFDSLGGRPALVVVLSTAEVLSLRAGFTSGQLRYLSDASGGGQWFREWSSGLTTPVAIGVIVDGDTLLVRVDERG